MENVVSGRVENIVSSAGRGRAEGKIFYSVVVAGETYSCGTRPPAGVRVGDAISFRCEVRDGKWKSAFDLRVVEDPGPGPAPGPPPAASSPARETPRPAAAPAPSTGGAVETRILAASVILAAWAQTARPIDWTLEEFTRRARDLAEKL